MQAEGRGEISLYAKGAVLMDAESGRVLYGKNPEEKLAMASTTKIMTCILVLELAGCEEQAEVSAYAASMPRVKLYVKKGEIYTIKNLLMALMLESFNDTAVVLAEHIGRNYLPEELRKKPVAEYTYDESRQAVSAFAKLMNEKAEELGCTDTNFITPNGLDDLADMMDENGVIVKEHYTTARDLALIMSYCVLKSGKSDVFREITATRSYTFTENNRTFTCTNHNNFMDMMEGAFSGKTGYTDKAGYCYVGALERDGRTFVVALLGSGWPNNKNYKWIDTKELMEFGLENYEYKEIEPELTFSEIPVENGASLGGNPFVDTVIMPEREGGVLPIRILLGEEEKVEVHLACKNELTAPVKKTDQIGEITYFLVDHNGDRTELARERIFAGADVEEKDFRYYLRFIMEKYLRGG